MQSPPLTDGVRAQARHRPGGWVYAIDPEFDPDGAVPPEGVVGAWPVSSAGEVEQEFVPNPRYRPSPTALEWRAPRSELEHVLQQTATGRASDEQLRAAFNDADVWVFSRPEGGLHVAVVGDGVSVVYVFTDDDLARQSGWSDLTNVAGRELARALPDGVQVLSNPGNVPFAQFGPTPDSP